LRLYDAAGTAASEEIRFNVRANDPVIAVDPQGGFVIAWSYFSPFLQRFDVKAMPVGNVQDISGYSGIAVLEDGSVAVSFTMRCGIDPLSIRAVFVQRFDAVGVPIGPPILVNETPGGAVPEIAADPSGGFVLVWERLTDAGKQVAGRRFTADGAATGHEFVVADLGDRSSFNTHFPASRSIAVGPSGDLLVAWTTGDDGDSFGIVARHIDGAGRRVGGESLVNTGTADWQVLSAVAADQSGRFIIVWVDWVDRLGGTSYLGDIRGQRVTLIPGDTESVARPCPADCDADGHVEDVELAMGLHALFDPEILRCHCHRFDTEPDGRATAADLVRAVQAAIAGCAT
jgi:hypothetical protein